MVACCGKFFFPFPYDVLFSVLLFVVWIHIWIIFFFAGFWLIWIILIFIKNVILSIILWLKHFYDDGYYRIVIFLIFKQVCWYFHFSLSLYWFKIIY
jgi:hypothetical protein